MIKLITKHKEFPLLLVDTEEQNLIPPSTWVLNNTNGEIDMYNPHEGYPKFFSPIIAASPKLGDLPLLPELPKQEEYVISLAEGYAVAYSGTDKFNAAKFGWLDGYKAASKKWSDEDMKKGMLEYAKWLTGGPKSMSFASTAETAMKRIIQSLSPTLTPIEFEPEYEDELSAYYKNGLGGKQELKIVDGVLQGTYKFK